MWKVASDGLVFTPLNSVLAQNRVQYSKGWVQVDLNLNWSFLPGQPLFIFPSVWAQSQKDIMKNDLRTIVDNRNYTQWCLAATIISFVIVQTIFNQKQRNQKKMTVNITLLPPVVFLLLFSWPSFPEYLPDEPWPLTTFPALMFKNLTRIIIIIFIGLYSTTWGHFSLLNWPDNIFKLKVWSTNPRNV